MDKSSLNRILTLLVKESRVKGYIDSARVKKVLKAIRSLPYPQSIIILKKYKERIGPLWAKETLILESAVTLKREEMKAVIQTFKKKYDFVRVVKEINPDLFGGLRIRIGSLIYDLSVRGRINKLKEKIFL